MLAVTSYNNRSPLAFEEETFYSAMYIKNIVVRPAVNPALGIGYTVPVA